MSRLLIGRVACEKKEKRWPKLIRPSLVAFISIRLSAACRRMSTCGLRPAAQPGRRGRVTQFPTPTGDPVKFAHKIRTEMGAMYIPTGSESTPSVVAGLLPLPLPTGICPPAGV